MNHVLLLAMALLLVTGCTDAEGVEATGDQNSGWISLFDGESFDGWSAGDNADTFSVEDGMIKIDGPRSHLYYTGNVENHNFRDFEFEAQVMTREGANSGIYFHTQYQESGWPATGYEVQINNSAGDWKRTGSLYDVQEVMEKYVQDDQWFTMNIKVEGKRVVVRLDDITVIDYTEPENPIREPGEREARILSSGTFALQAHDPNSQIYFREIRIRPLTNLADR